MDDKTTNTADAQGSQLAAGNTKPGAGVKPADAKTPTDTATLPATAGNVSAAQGTVDTSDKALTDKAQEDTARAKKAGKAVDTNKVEIGDKYKVVNLLANSTLVNPYTKEEFEFNVPVDTEVDGFLLGQYKHGRVRLEK